MLNVQPVKSVALVSRWLLLLLLYCNPLSAQQVSFFKNGTTRDEIQLIKISQLAHTFRVHTIWLKREGASWNLPSESGFPVSQQVDVEKWIQSFLDLKIQAKVSTTIDLATCHLLDLNDKEKINNYQNAGIRVQFFDINKNVLGDLIVGKTEDNKTAIRKANENSAYLVNSINLLSADPWNWIDGRPLNIESSKIQRINFSRSRGDAQESDESHWPFQLRENKFDSFSLLKIGQNSWNMPGIRDDHELAVQQVQKFLDQIKSLKVAGVKQSLLHESKAIFNQHMELAIEVKEAERIFDLDVDLTLSGFDFYRVDKKLLLAGQDRVDIHSSEGIRYSLFLGRVVDSDSMRRIATDNDEYYALFRAYADEKLIDQSVGDQKSVFVNAQKTAAHFNSTYSDWIFVVSIPRDLFLDRYFFTRAIQEPGSKTLESQTNKEHNPKRFYEGVDLPKGNNDVASRLIVWSRPESRWSIWLENIDEKTTREIPTGQLVLRPGKYRLRANPVFQAGVFNSSELYEFELRANQVSVLSLGGTPLKMELIGDTAESAFSMSLAVPVPESMWSHAKKKLIGFGSRRPRGAKDIALNQAISIEPSNDWIDAKKSNTLCIFNPLQTAALIQIEAKSSKQSFWLQPNAVRAINHRIRSELKISSQDSKSRWAENKTIKGIDGLSLYTLGGATAFLWTADPRHQTVYIYSARESMLPPSDFHSFEDQPTVNFKILNSEREMISVIKDNNTNESDLPDKLLDDTDADANAEPNSISRPGSDRKKRGAVLAFKEEGRTRFLFPFVTKLPHKGSPNPLGEISAHPDVSVQLFPLPKGLENKPIEAFSITKHGSILVSGGKVYDAGTGKILFEGEENSGRKERIASAVISNDGLLMVSDQARLASINDGKLELGLSLVDPTLKLWIHPNTGNVFVFDGDGLRHGFQLENNRVVPISFQAEPVSALGFSDDGLLVAFQNEIQLRRQDEFKKQWHRVIELPDGHRVIGLHDHKGLLLFSTRDAIYKLENGIASTIVNGIGGELFPFKDGLIVRDRHSMKLLHVQSKIFHLKRK